MEDKMTMKPTEPTKPTETSMEFDNGVPTLQELEALTKADPWLQSPEETMMTLYKLWDKDTKVSSLRKTETKKKVFFKLTTSGSTKNFLIVEALKHNQNGFWNLFWKQSKPNGRYLVVVPKKKLSAKTPRPRFATSQTQSVPNSLPAQAHTTWGLVREIAIMDLERAHYKKLCTELRSQLAEKGILDYWKAKYEADQNSDESPCHSSENHIAQETEDWSPLKQPTLLGGVDIEPPKMEGLDKLGEAVGHA